MARQEADRKLGYYPVHPKALETILPRLELSASPAGYSILDPCAGEGAAVKQLADHLAIPDRNVYCVEIEPDRAAKCQEAIPGAHVVHASVFHTRIAPESISLAYCNPPYGNLPGGGSAELAFLSQAGAALVPNGVLLAVLPERVTNDKYFRKAMMAHFDTIQITPLPREYRPNWEVFVLAFKRPEYVNPEAMHWVNVLAPPRQFYELAPAEGPGASFQRAEYDDGMLWALLEQSPLEHKLAHVEETPIARPPLALGPGHLALLLSGGMLDGLITPPDEPPHVVRGTCRKTQVLAEEIESDLGKGEYSVRQVFSERMDLIVRTVDTQGVMRTLSSGE